jgi:hypothetical protein
MIREMNKRLESLTNYSSHWLVVCNQSRLLISQRTSMHNLASDFVVLGYGLIDGHALVICSSQESARTERKAEGQLPVQFPQCFHRRDGINNPIFSLMEVAVV